jgi:hypothetical protein
MGFDFKEEMKKKDINQKLHEKVKLFNATLWDNKANIKKVNSWLGNFVDDENVHALYLLTQFIYFSDFQIKKMLVSTYRDFFKYRQIEKIRIENDDTLNETFIKEEYKKVLSKTRFVSLGNPAESSAHLMYNFRIENQLSKDLFISDSEISACSDDIEHFVFIDDICASGHQAVEYTFDNIPIIREKFPNAKIYYFMLIGTKGGKAHIKDKSNFDFIDSVLELDETYKCFSPTSRIFKNKEDIIDIEVIKQFSGDAGKELIKSIIHRQNPNLLEHELEESADLNKYGYNDGQLLIAFSHNTPDNTLPIFWYGEDMLSWNPIFKRANKIYS